MKTVRGDDARGLGPTQQGPHWIEGPHTSDRLDVGVVHLEAGGVTPPHAHVGGQVMVVIEGRGFVQTADERVVMEPGDIVIADPGEHHVHGAVDESHVIHLTITTGPHLIGEPPEN